MNSLYGKMQMDNNLALKMSFRKEGKIREPIRTFKVNESTIIAIYKGSLSPFDILIKYRQKLRTGKWSRIRTPKHIHWTVDILMKMQSYRQLTEEFIDFFIEIWNSTKPIKSENERQSLNLESLLNLSQRQIDKFEELSKRGEYSVRFLILLAKLLMLQEKTNLENAYMFKKLLDSLKRGKDLFDILSIASHTGR